MASRGVNKAIIVGNLGADPETRYTSGGTAVTNINVATSDSWRDKSSNEMQERTEWHRVVFFARLAEVAGEYLRKGSKVYIEGQIRTRKWQNKDGVDQYTTEIVAKEMQMLDSKGDNSGGGHRSGQHKAPSRGNNGQAVGNKGSRGPQDSAQTRGGPAGDPGFDDDLDDDIPF